MDFLLQRFSDISIGTLSGSTIGRDFPLPSLWFWRCSAPAPGYRPLSCSALRRNAVFLVVLLLFLAATLVSPIAFAIDGVILSP